MPNWFCNLKDILECLSYIVTIGGLIAIAISIKEFNKNAERDRKQDDQLLIQNSIDVLRKFSEKIIPEISDAEQQLNSEIEKQRKIALSQINSKLPKGKKLEALPDDRALNRQILYNSKNNCNYGQIFNELEQVSVYMNYHMVKEELVYIPLHKIYLNFVHSNINYLNELRDNEAPYANVISLYKTWIDKNKVEVLEKQRRKVEEEINKIKNS